MSVRAITSVWLCIGKCRNWWVLGTDHAGARLAALGPSCIYRPRPPYF